MGKTSAKTKNRWTSAHYDRLSILVKKGEKEKLQAIAASEGISVARLFSNCINKCYPETLEELDGTLPSMRKKTADADLAAPDDAVAASASVDEETSSQEEKVSEGQMEANTEDTADME